MEWIPITHVRRRLPAGIAALELRGQRERPGELSSYQGEGVTNNEESDRSFQGFVQKIPVDKGLCWVHNPGETVSGEGQSGTRWSLSVGILQNE